MMNDCRWSILTLMIMIIFGIEWAGNSTFQRNYFMSLFFFLGQYDTSIIFSRIPTILGLFWTLFFFCVKSISFSLF